MRVEFRLASEQLGIAAAAGVNTHLPRGDVFTLEGRLGATLAQNRIFVGAQLAAPFIFGAFHWVSVHAVRLSAITEVRAPSARKGNRPRR